jgi:hypothetical protein
MSHERIRQVSDFPKPDISRHLKRFLGLVNYSHNFIRNSTTIVHPLNKLLHNYNKIKIVVWTPEVDQSFESIRSEIATCTTTHNLIYTDPIFLPTDGSDYGVRAYLYRVADGKVVIIAFVSKSLTKPQLVTKHMIFRLVSNTILLANFAIQKLVILVLSEL